MDCKFPAWFWIALVATMVGPVAALDWRLEADDLHIGGVHVEQIEFDRGSGTVRIGPVQLADGTAVGRFELRCEAGTEAPCRRAMLGWTTPDSDPLDLVLELESERLTLEGPSMQLRLQRIDELGEEPGPWQLHATWPELGALPPLLPRLLGLSSLSGSLEIQGAIAPTAQDLQIELRDGGLDTPDGSIAAGELGLSLDWRRSEGSIAVDARWHAGEALLGPVYLAAPKQAVQVRLEGRSAADCFLKVERFAVEQLPGISIRGRGVIDPCRGSEGLDAEIELEHVDLAAAWALGLESLAGGAGWGGLEPRGLLSGAVELSGGRPIAGTLTLAEAALGDRDDRLHIDRAGLALDWVDAGREVNLQLDWAAAAIHRVPIGPVQLRLVGRDDVLRLEQALAVPVLDGRIVVETLEWRDWRSAERDLALAARLEPIGLAALTRSLGWTEFGGQLSGRIPGLRVVEGVIELEGGLELALFDGRARVSGLSIERPFGALPALAADIEFEALDLALLTGAFEIGSMRGRVSGHLRELRLLDWQPVRFDAWFETLDTGRDRWISQKAVDSLSTLGGGGSAALSGTLLQIFEDFPYRRIGLGCRLERNICEMRGLETVEGGGYMIIEGRPLPVLNVVGHRTRVDWPQLVSQLIALTES